MKKVFKTIAFLMAVSAALTACKAELKESIETPHEISFSAGEVEDPVGDEAEETDGIETRTVFGTASGTSVPTLWTSNQNVDIFYSGKGGVQKSELSVTPSSNGKTAKFFGTVKPASGTGFVLLSPAACYSSHSNTSASVVVPTTQTPTSASPDEKAMILGDATGKYVSLPTTVKFSPKHMTSYIALTLKNTLSAGKTPTVTLTATVPISGNAVFDYSGTTPTLKAASSGSSNSITVKPTGLSGIWFACIPARVSGKKLTISVTGSAGTLTREITVPSGKNLLAGQIAVLTVDMNPSTTVPVTGVSLNKTSLTLDAGKSETLTATVTPSNATDKSVTWSSSNTAVATVSSEGVVTGVKAGTATITATTNDGGKTATCAVTVNSSVVQLEAVDLGLSVKWANKNVGSDRPENVGDYISWGETAPKENYAWDTYKWGQSTSHLTKYVWRATFGTVDNRNVLLPDDDAATVNLGGKWRLPTQKEAQELISQCTYVEKNLNGISGYEFTGKNGKTLFFPITCMMIGSGLADESETSALFWLKDLNVSNNNSWGASFGCHATNRFIAWTNRYVGLTVRAVDGSNDIAVSSITLNKSSLSLVVSGTETLTATVAPSTATIPDVVWSSSNTSVATVDYTGKVTALKAGTAVIKASSYDGGKTATCAVTVNQDVYVTSLTILNKKDGEDALYDEGALHITPSKKGTIRYKITYSDGTVASSGATLKISSGSGVSISGSTVSCTAVSQTATITVQAKNPSSGLVSGHDDSITIKTWSDPTSIETSFAVPYASGAYWCKTEESYSVTATVYPSTARQKVVMEARENVDYWVLTRTTAAKYYMKAPAFSASDYRDYINKMSVFRLSAWHDPSVNFDYSINVTNIDVSKPKLFDFIAYNESTSKYRIFDGGLRISGTGDDFYCSNVSLSVPSGFKVVGIVTYYPDNPKIQNPYEMYSQGVCNLEVTSGIVGPDGTTLPSRKFHGFAIAMYNAVADKWCAENDDVDNNANWSRELGGEGSYYSKTRLADSQKNNGFMLTIAAHQYNLWRGSSHAIRPADRVWDYGEPGVLFQCLPFPTSTPSLTWVMRPWFVPTVYNWEALAANGKYYNTKRMNKLNEQIGKVGFGDKVFPYQTDSYWTINTDANKNYAYIVYSEGRATRAKSNSAGVRPFMIF
jgi:uncharacterized protein YjdB